MVTLDEQDLRISLENAMNGEIFDRNEITSGTSLQPVDLIFELENYYLFVEVKDPDIPTASNPQAFIDKLNSGKLIRKVAGKFRDTTFFKKNQSMANKAIKYVLFLSMASLDSALILAKQEELRKLLPATHQYWEENISCMVLNVQRWPNLFGTDSIIRISESDNA